jgi:hypothetical protein
MTSLTYQADSGTVSERSVFLTENELAARWRRTPMTLQRMRKDGRLPFVRIGKSPRYRLSEIERVEAEGTV